MTAIRIIYCKFENNNKNRLEMKKKTVNSSTLIKELDITVRAKSVLSALGIFTIKDLCIMYILEIIPKVGTVVRYYPFSRTELVYTKKVNEEVKEILMNYTDVVELDEVGVL